MSKIYHDVGFVHLHVHSSYSLLEGALKIATLTELAKGDDQPALALTDTNNLYGALEFSEKAASSGIQPIIGAQLNVLFEEAQTDHASSLSNSAMGGIRNALRDIPSVVLLAQNEQGYANLLKLVSAAHLKTVPEDAPHICLSDLSLYNDGLIMLTGGASGALHKPLKEGQVDAAQLRLQKLNALFADRLYIEIQRHHIKDDKLIEQGLINLAYEHHIPLVATNEPYFAASSDYEAHDALLAVAAGRLLTDDDRRKVTPDHRFKTRAEMKRLFADIPEALTSTVEIAMRCAFKSPTRKPILPRFISEAQSIQQKVSHNSHTHQTEDAEIAAEAQELKQQSHLGLKKRFISHGIANGLDEKTYIDRLDFELNVIERMKYPGYFLIVADFIKWAKEQGIPVGPGRGSGAGSLVAFALTITDIDPLRFGLLFERFLNPERVSMPDFDIDFCQDRREEVIAYVRDRYGEDRVAQIITFGTLQARGVLRDVGRVLEMPYGQVDKLTKLVPQNPANPVTLSQAIIDEPKLREAAREEPIVQRLLTIAQKLEGLHRHASTHAAGVVIGDRPLDELVPLVRDSKTGMRVTQFNMKWVEAAGLVKFDFLGLKTLTVLKKALDLIQRKGITVDLEALPLDDEATYAMLRRGETVGVFQLESVGMRKALVEMNADRFEDLIALVALYRPGPMANIPTYCARKNGREKADYLHPDLESVLKETHGIIVYQEQVMQAAQVLAGYSLGDADLLRRAMGKKIKSEMDAQRERFVSGAIAQNLSDVLSNEIFDLLAKFADYGFNKSHAAAYALIAYQTAYLKANYPVEFLAATMTLELDNTDKIAEFRREAQRLGIVVEPPCIQTSDVVFEVHDGRIRYALAAIKGVGRQAIESLIAVRYQSGFFKDISDIAKRIDPKLVNRRTLENLIAAGALDKIEPDRAKATEAVDVILALAQRTRSSAQGGQNELFGGMAEEPLRLPPHTPWLPSERLQREYAAVGFFLTGHPLDDYGTLLGKLGVKTWVDFCRGVRRGQSVGKLAVSVLDRTERRTKSGSKMGIINLSDQTGHFEAIIFSEGLQSYRELLEAGQTVLVSVQANIEGDEVRARILSAEPLDQAVAKHQKGLSITINSAQALEHIHTHLNQLHSTQKESNSSLTKGYISLKMNVNLQQPHLQNTHISQNWEVEIRLKQSFAATPDFANQIRMISGVTTVEAV